MTLSDLAKYSMTRSTRGLSATAQLLVKTNSLLPTLTGPSSRLSQTITALQTGPEN